MFVFLFRLPVFVFIQIWANLNSLYNQVNQELGAFDSFTISVSNGSQYSYQIGDQLILLYYYLNNSLLNVSGKSWPAFFLHIVDILLNQITPHSE